MSDTPKPEQGGTKHLATFMDIPIYSDTSIGPGTLKIYDKTGRLVAHLYNIDAIYVGKSQRGGQQP